MEGLELIIPIVGGSGVASWLGTIAANKTNLSNLKSRIDEIIADIKEIREKQHGHDVDLEIIKMREMRREK